MIRKNSEIYLDTIKKYKNKTSSEINKMNSSKNIIPFMLIPINFNNSLFFFFIIFFKNINKNKTHNNNNKINQDTIFE